MLEVELGRIVARYFAGAGDVFPEVRIFVDGPRADFVVRRSDGGLDVVECKRRPNSAMLAQAAYWLSAADRVWLAYEPPRRGAVAQRWIATCVGKGIGVIHVAGGEATVAASARAFGAGGPTPIWREHLRVALTPHHAEFGEGGNARSEFYSAFRLTCRNLGEYVRAHPGCTVRDAVGAIEHHYTSDAVARSAVLAWWHKGKVPGLRVDTRARPFRLYPAES